MDNIAPEFTFFPEDFEGNCEDYVFSAAIAEDNCGDAIVDFTDDTISTNPTLEIIRTWAAIDPCVNLNEQIQSISKSDTEMPVVECPPINTVFIVAGGTYLMYDLIPLVNGSDNCTDDLIFTQSVSEGQALDLGENTVVVEANDEFDNTGVCNAIVDVHISTSLHELNENLIRVFPNPLSDFLVIEIDELKSNLSFRIFDSQGKLVQSSSLNTNRTSLRAST